MVEIGLVVIVIMGLCWYWESKLEKVKQARSDEIFELKTKLETAESDARELAKNLKYVCEHNVNADYYINEAEKYAEKYKNKYVWRQI